MKKNTYDGGILAKTKAYQELWWHSLESLKLKFGFFLKINFSSDKNCQYFHICNGTNPSIDTSLSFSTKMNMNNVSGSSFQGIFYPNSLL